MSNHYRLDLRRTRLAERERKDRRRRRPLGFEPVADLIKKIELRELERHALFESLRSTYGVTTDAVDSAQLAGGA